MTETSPRGRRANGLPSVARHGQLRQNKPWALVLKVLAAVVAVLLVSGASVAGLKVMLVQDKIKTM